jgi:SAM-dependent methyltransferase
MRALKSKNPGLQVKLFDVSDRYIPFWKKFLNEDRWATYAIPAEWDNQFDVVTSLFSLEHMAHPQRALQQIFRVLKTDGIFYGIIPNVFTNTADLIVVDHVNHFTSVSLDYLLRSNGFEVVEIDEKTHRGALVFKAKKKSNLSDCTTEPSRIQSVFDQASEIALYWQNIGSKIKEFENSVHGTDRLAIYGAGFYGTFISICMKNPERISCVVDQNTFLQGRKINGVEIVAPADLPKNINVVMVGLNPAHAKAVIEDIPEFRHRQLTYFYL